MSDVNYQIEEDMPPVGGGPANDNATAPAGTERTDQQEKEQVGKWIRKIKDDLAFHKKAFDRMRRDMRVAFKGWDGTDDNWNEKLYVANVTGRHIKQKTAQLYAKNPRIVAQRRETMDFTIWDETPDSLKTAFQTMQMATQAMQQIGAQMAAAPPQVDPMTGQPMPPQPPQIPPQVEQAVQMAQATIQDYQKGMVRRQQIKKLGKTLEILFNNAMRTQRPISFKKGMKGVVRRCCATGVGYVEQLFERQMGPSPVVEAEMKDAKTRLEHLQRLMEEAQEGEIQPDDPEMLELQQTISSLQDKKDLVLVEGLIYDYPLSTKVIPDKLCTQLDGFIGARHVTIEYAFTCDQVEEKFPGTDLKKGNYKGYSSNDFSIKDGDSANFVSDQDDLFDKSDRKRDKDIVRVWKTYDKLTGMVFYTAEGYDKYLRPPAPPDVTVATFWPIYALIINETESEDELFPLSDVALMRSQQKSINSSRQGKAEHRMAARPRFWFKNGALEQDAQDRLRKMVPYDTIGINAPDGVKLEDLVSAIKIPGVDPNLYDTNEAWSDVQVVVGSTAPQMGGASPDITATQSQISASSANDADGSSIDELNEFLTMIAQGGGAILLRETSPEKVLEIAGPGAFWPDMTNEQIMDEIYLEVEAGSMGKPNQALELANFQKMLPFLVQMPGISPTWLARESVRRLDDDVDLTEALSSGIPSIVAQNALASAAAKIGGPPPDGSAGGGPPMPPGAAGGAGPAAQGAHGAAGGPGGAMNGPAAPPEAQAGSVAPMGSNHTGVFG